MAKKEHCVYRAVKLDVDIIGRVKAAAAMEDRTFQEWASDVLNAAASERLNMKPVSRKPPPEKPHGKGRPPKSAKP